MMKHLSYVILSVQNVIRTADTVEIIQVRSFTFVQTLNAEIYFKYNHISIGISSSVSFEISIEELNVSSLNACGGVSFNAFSLHTSVLATLND